MGKKKIRDNIFGSNIAGKQKTMTNFFGKSS